MGNSTNGLKKLLDDQLKFHNQKGFIEKDPISIPHRFATKQDIEIAGFFAAIFAWGQQDHHYQQMQRVNAVDGPLTLSVYHATQGVRPKEISRF